MQTDFIKKYGEHALLPLATLLKRELVDRTFVLQFEDIFDKLGLIPQHKYRKIIRDTFVTMQKDGFFECAEDLATVKTSDLVTLTTINIDQNLKQILLNAIDKILAYQGSESKYKLMNVYYAIKVTNTLHYPTLKVISGVKHNKTLKNQIEILKQLQLL